MTPKQLRAIRRCRKESQAAFGKLLGLTDRTIRTHENAKNTKVPKWLEYAVKWVILTSEK